MAGEDDYYKQIHEQDYFCAIYETCIKYVMLHNRCLNEDDIVLLADKVINGGNNETKGG